MARRRLEAPRVQVPAWMVTYADLMSLMLTFFILLVSFSEVQRGKLAQALQSIQNAMGGETMGLLPVGPGAYGTPPDAAAVESIARRLQERLQVRGRDRDVRLELDPDGGLRINLPSRILFDSGSAQLKADPQTYSLLEDVAEMLADVPGAWYEIRGHTDSRPLTDTTVFGDNYELSFARAMVVTRYLSEGGGIPLEQFEVVACGPGRPVATNDTAEGQAANRRVEIRVRGALTPREARTMRTRAEALQRGADAGESPAPVPR